MFFLVKVNQSIDLFNYQFKISSTLSNDQVLIYGFYTFPKTKTISYIENKSFRQPIFSFNDKMANYLKLSPNIITIMRRFDLFIHLSDLFTEIIIKKTQSMECLLDYQHYISKIKSILSLNKDNSKEIKSLHSLFNSLLSGTKSIKKTISFNLTI